RTARAVVSTVVKRRPHSGQERRRRIAAPSSASRESTTRESGCRQNGQCTLAPFRLFRPGLGRSPVDLWTTCATTCGGNYNRVTQDVVAESRRSAGDAQAKRRSFLHVEPLAEVRAGQRCLAGRVSAAVAVAGRPRRARRGGG